MQDLNDVYTDTQVYFVAYSTSSVKKAIILRKTNPKWGYKDLGKISRPFETQEIRFLFIRKLYILKQ